MNAWDGARGERLAAANAAEEWERYRACTPLPHPQDSAAMNDYLTAAASTRVDDISDALERLDAAADVLLELQHVRDGAQQLGRTDVLAAMQARAEELQVCHRPHLNMYPSQHVQLTLDISDLTAGQMSSGME